MVASLSRAKKFEYGLQLHDMATNGRREISGRTALEYEECFWKEVDRMPAELRARILGESDGED